MWWCAPHYQKGMPHSVARGRSQSIFCTINVLHCTTQALQSFVSFFTNANLQDTPLSWVLSWCKDGETAHWWENFWPRWWKDETLLPTTENLEKPIFLVGQAFWEALKNQSHRICGPCASNETTTEKSNKMDSIGPIEDQQKTWMCSMDHLSFPNIAKSTNDPRHWVLWLIQQLKLKTEASISSDHHRFKRQNVFNYVRIRCDLSHQANSTPAQSLQKQYTSQWVFLILEPEIRHNQLLQRSNLA